MVAGVSRLRLVLGLAVLLPACKTAKGVDIEPAALVPKDAGLVVGFDLKPLTTSPLGSSLAAVLKNDSETAALFTGFEKCEVDLEHLHAMVAATFASETLMAVVESPGVGDEKVVRCIETEIAEATGEDAGIIMFETKGDVRITPQEGGGHLIILNKNTIVIADAPWDTAVLEAIETPSARNTETPMAQLLKDAGEGSDMFLALTVGPVERQELGELPGGASMQSALMKVGLSEGAKLDAAFDFSEEADAGTFRTAVPGLFAMAKGELTGAGLPADLLDSLKFGGEGKQVTATWSVDAEAVSGIADTLGAAMQ